VPAWSAKLRNCCYLLRMLLHLFATVAIPRLCLNRVQIGSVGACVQSFTRCMCMLFLCLWWLPCRPCVGAAAVCGHQRQRCQLHLRQVGRLQLGQRMNCFAVPFSGYPVLLSVLCHCSSGACIKHTGSCSCACHGAVAVCCLYVSALPTLSTYVKITFFLLLPLPCTVLHDCWCCIIAGTTAVHQQPRQRCRMTLALRVSA
jgi:hypothetical protein